MKNKYLKLSYQWEETGVPADTAPEMVVPHLIRLVYEATKRNDWLASNAYWRHLMGYKGLEWCQWAREKISTPLGFCELLDELIERTI